MLDVRTFGATGDGQTNDQAAIQAAIDACSQAGGGTVYFSVGDYLSGTVRLRSHVTLYLDAGATLWASTDPSDYVSSTADPQHYASERLGHLLVADDVERIAIVGAGTIHGQGTEDYHYTDAEKPSFRMGLILFRRCQNVTMRGITILYSDAWTVHLKRCETVFIDGVTILNNIFRLNSDGIDPDSCQDVHISNCHIVAGDDCIVLKTEEPYPCENVVVTNCTLETTCTALKLGTGSRGDFRDIHFSNCTIRNTGVGVGFFVKDGGTVERVTFSNLSIETFSRDESKFPDYPIFMDIEKRHPHSQVGRIRDVVLRDVQIHGGSGVLIQGMPESRIENLTLQNLTFRVDQAVDYQHREKAIGGFRTTSDERDTRYARLPSYITLAHVHGLTLDNIRVLIAEDAFRGHQRSAVCGHELADGVLRNIHRQPGATDGAVPVVALHNCQNMLLRDCPGATETPAE